MSAPSTQRRARPFQPTRWSLIHRAVSADPMEARAALNDICQRYWYPIYAWIRRAGHSPEQSQDLTQGFFAALLRRNWFSSVDQTRGKLSSYLLSTLRFFLAEDHRRESAQKRGGGAVIISIDEGQAESRYQREPVDNMSPDRLFQRRWALTVLEHALHELAKHYETAGKGRLFRALKSTLGVSSEEAASHSYRKAAAELGMAEGAVRTAASRMRARFRHVLLDHVAETLATTDPAEIKAEMAELLGVL